MPVYPPIKRRTLGIISIPKRPSVACLKIEKALMFSNTYTPKLMAKMLHNKLNILTVSGLRVSVEMIFMVLCVG